MKSARERAGFHTEGGEGEGPGILPPSRNLETEYGYYCGTGHKYASSKQINVVSKVCLRLRQKQSERI